jgi:cytochrome P450
LNIVHTGQAATDLELDGSQIAAGAVLTILLAFANTDLAAFGPEAERFDSPRPGRATALTPSAAASATASARRWPAPRWPRR